MVYHMLRNDIWMILRYCSARITQHSNGSQSILSLGTPWLAAVILRASLIVMCLSFPAYGQTVTPLESTSGLDQRPRNTTCVAPERPSTDTPIRVTRAFPNLVLPDGNLIALGQAPHDRTRQFAATRLGLIISFQHAPDVSAWHLVLDIRTRVTGIHDGAFLNFAFHPNFPADNRVFMLYTATAVGTPDLPYVVRVSSFLSRDNGQTLDPTSERIVLEIGKPLNQCHNGGMLAFGQDGYLYISTGDGCQPRYAQDVQSLEGKILRLDVDSATPYGIPPENPFAQGGGRPEIYAWGLRNPFRGNFDPATGQLWVGDVGAGGFEEINLIQRGKNYGWPITEGKHCWPLGTTCTMEGLELPVVELDRRGLAPFWVVGGYVYRGTAVPALVGTYIFAEGWSGTLYALAYDQQGHPLPKVLLETGRVIYSLAQDAAGEIYVVNLRTIDQITPAGPGTPSTFPTVLSQTGCVDPADTSEPASGLIPYDVNTPLWSDGTAKRRWMALPEGGQVHINPDGDWDYPLGTVLVKSFRLGEQLVETRLLMRHSDGEWAGYSYEWNAQQTDATLVPSGGKVKEVNGQTWMYPSRAACLLCHTAAAGRTLGLETAQMNRTVVYPTTGRTANQMTTLAHIGVFDPASTAGVPADPRRLPALAALHDTSKSVDQRARSYLHANCAFCHRPDGGGRGPEDFRFHLLGSQIHALDVIPTLGNLGVPDARLIAPGAPEKSIISLRMHAVSDVRMPPVASRLVDPEGTAMVDRWIRAFLWFDLNGDDTIDTRDVGLLQQAIGTQNPKADLNGDGVVGTLDVNLMQRLLGPVVAYPLDGTAEEATGQGQDGVIQGAVEIGDRFGTPNKAYNFNGIDSVITVGALPEALSGDFSVTYWMQSTASRRMHAMSLGTSPGANLDFNFNGDGVALWVYWNSSGTQGIRTTGLPAGSLTDGQWHHIVLQRTDTRVELYVDGRLQGSTTSAGVMGAAGPLRLGRGSSNTLWWHGALDDVRVYRRALSAPELATLSQERLLVYYPLDGTAEEATGQGHDGVVQGAVETVDRFGTPNKAYNFNGLDSVITVGALPEALRGDFSVTYWMQSTASRRMHAMSLGTSTGANLDFNFNGDGVGLWVYWNSSGTQGIRTTGLPAGSLTDGQWHHIVLQRTGTRVELYVDGRLQGSTTSAGVMGAAGPLRLGRGSSNTLWWNGALDDVRVYRRALSVPELTALSQERLLAHYPLDGTAEEATGQGHDGVVQGAVATGDRFGARAKAYWFNGLNSVITVDTLPEALSGDFSFTYWMQSTASRRMHAMSLGTSTGANLDFNFNGDGVALWVYWNSSGTQGIRTTGLPAGSLTDGQWHHLVLQRTGARVELYVDGRLEGNTTYAGVMGAAGPLRLGRGSYNTLWWNGALDDVRVYRRALSAPEITTLSQERLLVYYPLDGTAAEATGQGHDGVVQGAMATGDRFGAREKAYGFNGLNSVITVDTLPEALSGDFSVTYWMQSTASRRMHAMSLGTSTGANLDFNFNGDGVALWVYWNSSGTQGIRTTGLPAGSLTDGQWHHIGLRRAGTRVELYVDGRLQGSTTSAGVMGAAGPLRLGRGSSNTLWWNGALDDVRVYRRALSAPELTALSQDTLRHDGLLAYYPLDGTADDASGHGQHGVVNKALLAPDRFLTSERAYRFLGVESSITVATLPQAFSGDFSLTYWMQSSATHRMHALSLGDISGANLDFNFNDSSYALWVYWNSSGTQGIQTTGLPVGSLTDGQWHHIGLRRAGTRVELYVDGRLQGSTTSAGVMGAAGPLRLGRGSSSTLWWNGALDDVRVYGRALSATEMAALSDDQPALRLLALNRGEALRAGGVYDITWVAAPGVISVRLDYSIDGGITWSEISAATPAALGRYAWMVPDTASRLARIRIRNATDGLVSFVGTPFLIVRGRQLWDSVTEHASFPPRDGFGPLVFRGKMWMLGGWNLEDPSVYRSVWSSNDGQHWQLVTQAPWSGVHGAGYVVYDDKMWIIGSDVDAGVWWSADGRTWIRALENAPWGQRYKPYVLVYDNKIWLMGGLDFFDGRYIPYNDVWNSTDGVHWTQVITHAAWAPRGIMHGTVVFQGKMWILGGGLYAPPPDYDLQQEVYYHDVWNSTNGVDWHLVTSAAPWLPRIHHNTFVYADKMWVMAGHDYGMFQTGLKNDVWVSSNGEDWSELVGTPWSKRHAAGVFVYDDTLWLVAGYFVNDVWKLRLSGNIAINNDDVYTHEASVTLTIAAPSNDVASMQLSNDGVVWSAPETYTTTRAWTLAPGAGQKTVYVRFRDTHGVWSEAYKDHIIRNLDLMTPHGGESLLAGSVYDITWRAERHIATVKLAYSMDDGTTWHEITAATPATVGRYAWTIPDISSRLCRIRLSDAADGGTVTVSAEVFSVLHATDGLVAYYPFDGDADDTSGNNKHGVVHGAVLTVDRFGAVDSAYSFAGPDFIEVSELPVIFDADFSMAYWVHSSASYRMHALSLGDSVGTNVDFDFNDAPYGLGVYWNGNGAIGMWPAAIPVDELTDGQWHHLVFRRAGAQIGLYVDGALRGSTEYLGVIGAQGPLYIGRGSYNILGWNGVIDDVRIYNRALGDDEIVSLSTDSFR